MATRTKSQQTAYVLGQITRLISINVPEWHDLVTKVPTAGTLSDTWVSLTIVWMPKARAKLAEQGKSNLTEYLDSMIGELIDAVDPDDLRVQWTVDLQGHYQFGYHHGPHGRQKYSVTEAATRQGVSRQTILSRIKAETLPAQKLHGRWVVKGADLDAWTAGKPGPKPKS